MLIRQLVRRFAVFLLSKTVEDQEYLKVLISTPGFSGHANYCNVCGHRFSQFALCNNRKFRAAECPVCKSRERHRHLFIHLSALYPFLKGKKVLHFAPESRLKKLFLDSGCQYIDADIDQEKASHHVGITAIPYGDNEFDYIFCMHVLEHIPDDTRAMQELYRVLKPGGTAYLAVPLKKEFREDLSVTDPEKRMKLFGQEDHVRQYNEEVFCSRLEAVGFSLEVSRPQNFPEPYKEAQLGNYIVLARKKHVQ